MNLFKKICCVSILLAIGLMVLIPDGIALAQTPNQVAQSFSQYFSPQVLRAVDNMMKTRFNCQPLGRWKIWTDGFNRRYKTPEGKIDLILNWDGMYYIKNTEPEISGDWTLLK